MAGKRYVDDGGELVLRMLEYLNSWPEKPCAIGLDEYQSTVPNSAMLQPLQQAVATKSYINGDYKGQWSFAVYITVDGADTKARLFAPQTLYSMFAWMTARDELGRYVNIPELGKHHKATGIAMTGSPTLINRLSNGNHQYQAIFQLAYSYTRVISEE